MGFKDFLQGKWMGHPLHPAVVHVPMGLWPAAFIFDVLGYLGLAGPFFLQLSFFAIAIGLLVALMAVPTGWADWTGIKREKPAWKLGLIHMVLNVAAMLVWLLNLMIRIPELHRAEPVTGAALTLSLIGTLILGVGGWFGKRMVFSEGTSVGRSSKEELRKVAERGGAALPEE